MKLRLGSLQNQYLWSDFDGDFEDVSWRFTRADHKVEVIAEFSNSHKKMLSFSSRKHVGRYSVEFNWGDGMLCRIQNKLFSVEECLAIAVKYWEDDYNPKIDYECDCGEAAWTMSEKEIDDIFERISKPWWKFW